MYFRLMAAIFDLSLTTTSESIHTIYRIAQPRKYLGIAVGISVVAIIVYNMEYVWTSG